MIIIEDYNTQWAEWFAELKALYQKQLAGLFIAIEHVGSTSVQGLAAKPVIDIDIIIEDTRHLAQIIEKLEQLGYKHVGDLGITGREAFKRLSDLTPMAGSFRQLPKHNLYVCPANSLSLQNHLQLRDYLRNHPDTAKKYGDLKKQLAIKYAQDMDRYVEGKTEFITNILKLVGFSNNDLENIALQNKAL